MVTARDLSQLAVRRSPFSVGLPVGAGWVVVVDTGSEVDLVLGVGGPDATVVAHGDVEEVVVLLVEDVGPAIALGGGFGDSGSVVGFAFGVDADELGVVSRVDLDEGVSGVVLDQDPAFFDVVDVGLLGDFTSLENPNVIFRIDSPDNSFFSRGDESLSAWELLPACAPVGVHLAFFDSDSLEDLVVEVDGPKGVFASVDVLPFSFDGFVAGVVLGYGSDVLGNVGVQREDEHLSFLAHGDHHFVGDWGGFVSDPARSMWSVLVDTGSRVDVTSLVNSSEHAAHTARDIFPGST